MSLDNNFKTRSTKGYYGIMKGVVTRNILHLPKPELATVTSKIVNSNKWEIQVWIPAYHGGNAPDITKIGTALDVGEYPWAQMCGPLFKDNIGEGEPHPDIWSNMFSDTYLKDVPAAYPGIGDVVWLLFENGDINRPVFVGSLLSEKNIAKYTTHVLGGSLVPNVGVPAVTLPEEEIRNIVALNGAQMKYPLVKETRISSPFGWRKNPTAGGRKLHNGVDFADGGARTYIVASHDGTAVAKDQATGYGRHVIITGKLDGMSIQTYYGHMNNFCNISPGQSKNVRAGEVIGQVGSTGNSTGPHLHFGLKLPDKSFTYVDSVSGMKSSSNFVDPMPYIALR